MLLMRVTDMEYRTEEDGTALEVVGRDQRGSRKQVTVEGVDPYVFVPEDQPLPSEVTPNDRRCVGSETGYEGYDGTPLKKVFLRHPKDVNGTCSYDCCGEWEFSETYTEVYEGDIPFTRRASIDYGLSGYIEVPSSESRVHIDDIKTNIDSSQVKSIEPRVMMADIEAMPPEADEPFDEFASNATKPVTAITLYDTYEEEYVALVLDGEDKVSGKQVKQHLAEHWDDHDRGEEYVNASIVLERANNEESLLCRFIEIVENRQPDLLSGWNWIDFDHEYLWKRMKKVLDSDSRKSHHDMSDVGTVGGYRTAQVIDGLPGFDMMNAFCGKMTFSEWRSQSLDYVASEELDVGKIENVSIGKEYENNRSRFLAYNIIDTQLLVELDRVQGIHEFFFQLADLCSVQVYDAFYEMRMVDGFIMSHREKDEILPSGGEKDMDSIPGGLVLSPSNGVFPWVSVFDLKSLYPSVFITLNISPETVTYDPQEADVICPGMPESEDEVRGETITENDISWEMGEMGNGPQNGNAVGFTMDEEGIIPKYLKLLFNNRAEMKAKRNQYDPHDKEYEVYDNRQRAIKVVMNSTYGVLTSPYARLASEDLGAAITAGGRYTLWKGAQIGKEMGYNVRYGDTDSIMISLADKNEDVTPREVYERGMEIEDTVNDRMDMVADDFQIGSEHPFLVDGDLHGTDRHCLYWEFEKMYRRFLQAGSKKRYAGLPIWKEGSWYIDDKDDPNIVEIDDIDPDVTGFETERADVPVVTERSQNMMLKLLLAGADFDELSEYLSGEVQDVKEMNVDVMEVAEPSVVNKSLEDYPNMKVKRGCLYSNKHLGYDWREGDDPWLIPIQSTPSMVEDTDVIAIEWGETVPDGFEIDVPQIIEKKVRDPIEPLLDVAGYTFEELKTGRKVQSVAVESDGDDEPNFGGAMSDPDPPDDPFSGGGSSTESSGESSGSSGSALDW